MLRLADLMAALVEELRDGDIADPLAERFPLALLWNDLARLAGEPVPAEVAAFVDEPVCAPLDLARWMPSGEMTIVDILRGCPHPVA